MDKDHLIIRQIIGEGASSTVYRAFDTASGRSTAIKVFSAGRRGAESEEEGRILQILARAPNEHLVEFYGQVGPSAYAFELCECNLISFINEHELDLRGIKKIMRMVLLGLHHIHSHGIIHRDMKLGNILVKGDCIKLCDFGLSCLAAENDYRYCGTKDYLAPEMRAGNGSRYDEGIDVYAAGVIYRTLVSRRKESAVEAIEDGGVRDLISRMMAPDPGRRCTAREALRHSSFEELFSEIPRFEELRSLSKQTKHGRIAKGEEGGVSWIEIEYSMGELHRVRVEGVTGPYKRSAAGGDECTRECTVSRDDLRDHRVNRDDLRDHRVNRDDLRDHRVNRDDTQQYKVNRDDTQQYRVNREASDHRVKVDGIEIDKKCLTNSVLKRFNYLCSYFKIVCEGTVKYKDSDGRFTFSVTGNGTKYLEWDGKRMKRRPDGGFELVNKRQAGEALDRATPARGPTALAGVDQIFDRFDQKYQHMGTHSTEGSFTTEQQSSVNVPLSMDGLIKKYEYIENQGWAVKSGLTFVVLLNSGRRYVVDAEEQTVSDANMRKMKLEEVPVGLLEQIRDLVGRFLY